MEDNLKVGSIVEGKVINVKPYGAFVSLGNNKKGLVHISHISENFIKDINDYIKQGSMVKVKILSMEDNGEKISLSIKEAAKELNLEQIDEKPAQEAKEEVFEQKEEKAEDKKKKTFEEMMKEYNKQANDRQVDINKRLKR